MTARVRIGIVAWNVAEDLRRCLASLPGALGGVEAEIVVVDNDSHDDSADVAASFDGVRVVRSPVNLGYAKGMNLALGGTSAEFLIALNPDTIPAPGSLAALVESLGAHPRVGVVVPRLVLPDGSTQHSVHRFPTVGVLAAANLLPWGLMPARLRDRLWLPGSVRPGRSGTVDWAIGAVHGIRRHALESENPYNERWFIYVEDLDLCWTLARRGWQTRLEAEIEVLHVGGASSSKAFGSKVTARWTHETYDWHRRVHGAALSRLVAVLNLVGVLVRLPWRLPGMLARGNLRGFRGVLSVAWIHLRTALLGPWPPLPPPGPNDPSVASQAG